MSYYNDNWKRQRKLIKQELDPEAVIAYIPMQQTVILKFLKSLITQPQNFLDELRL